MTFLKSNITNDKIKYDINEDFVEFEIFILETKKELIKLVKFMLIKLQESSCQLPIRIKMNDYQKPVDMEINVDNVSKSLFRFIIDVKQEDFKKFFKFNFDKILKNNYDLELDYNGYVKKQFYDLVTEDKLNKISFDYQSHPYGVVFNLVEINDINQVLKLVSDMLLILNKADIKKPFKMRFKDLEFLEDTVYQSYDTTRRNGENDYLISHDNFMNFFKKNMEYFVNLANIHYQLEIEDNSNDVDDGWSVAVDKKKQRSKAHGNAKRKLFNQIKEIQNSV